MIGIDRLEVRRVLGGWSRAQWWLRSAQVLVTVVALIATERADGGAGSFWPVVALVVSAWAFFSPDSSAPALLIAVLVLGWWGAVDDPASGWLVVFAVSAFLIHALSALAAAGPPAATYAREVVWRWSLATLAVIGAVVVMWAALMLLDEATITASTWRVAVALGGVALLAGWLRLRSLGAPGATVRRADLRE